MHRRLVVDGIVACAMWGAAHFRLHVLSQSAAFSPKQHADIVTIPKGLVGPCPPSCSAIYSAALGCCWCFDRRDLPLVGESSTGLACPTYNVLLRSGISGGCLVFQTHSTRITACLGTFSVGVGSTYSKYPPSYSKAQVHKEHKVEGFGCGL